jgi:hypothetical protein
MRVTRFSNQKNLSELVARLYKVGQTPGTKAAAREALADANPQHELRRGRLVERLESGTLLVVPEVEGATYTDSSADLRLEVGAALLGRFELVSVDAEGALEASTEHAIEQLASRIDVLESQELQESASADLGVQERVALLGEQAHQSVRLLLARRAREHDALQAATETAAALTERLSLR